MTLFKNMAVVDNKHELSKTKWLLKCMRRLQNVTKVLFNKDKYQITILRLESKLCNLLTKTSCLWCKNGLGRKKLTEKRPREGWMKWWSGQKFSFIIWPSSLDPRTASEDAISATLRAEKAVKVRPITEKKAERDTSDCQLFRRSADCQLPTGNKGDLAWTNFAKPNNLTRLQDCIVVAKLACHVTGIQLAGSQKNYS